MPHSKSTFVPRESKLNTLIVPFSHSSHYILKKQVILLPQFCGRPTNDNAENKSQQSDEANVKVIGLAHNIRNRKLTRSFSNQFAPPEGYEPTPMLSLSLGEVNALSAGSLFSSASDFIDTMVENLGPGIPSIGLTNAGFAGPISSELNSSVDFISTSASKTTFTSELSQSPELHDTKPEPLSITMGEINALTVETGLLSEHNATSLLPVPEHHEHMIDMTTFGEPPSEVFSYSSSTTDEVTAAPSSDLSRNQEVHGEEKASGANSEEFPTAETTVRSPLFESANIQERAPSSNFSLDFHQEETSTTTLVEDQGGEDSRDGQVSTDTQLAINEHTSTNLETFPMPSEAVPHYGDSVKELLPKTSSALPKDFFVEPYDMI